MGNKTSVNFGCVSAPMNDGEFGEYSSVNTRSCKSSSYRHRDSSHSLSASSTDSALTPPAPSRDDVYHESDDDSHHDHGQHHDEYPYYAVNVKLLFLDVDGVLNNPNTKWDDFHNGIDDKLLKYLKLIILKTGCKIVLSTTWRLNENAKKILLHSFKTRADLNTDDIVIGQTKSLKSKGKHRVNEIYDYLKCNKYRFNIISWCALDDLPLNTFDQQSYKFMMGHFIKTNPKIGISPQNAFNCIDILNANDYAINSYNHYIKNRAYYIN